MKQVLIIGAGKSSSCLIKHLIENRVLLGITLTIVDINTRPLHAYVGLENVHLVEIGSGDIKEYEPYISKSFLTISMLPAFMHIEVARLCLLYNSHLITPSYISTEMQALEGEVKAKQLIFLNELGFDPGIDHLTTMKTYYDIVAKGGRLTSYRSYAGGLVAPGSDDNPWHYKFSWNPRNVILAGQGGEIKYRKDGKEETLTYQNLFSKNEILKLSQGHVFDAYANRDSLKYEKLYGWENLDTLLRGTLRIHGFCEAWSILVNLGLTDDSIKNKPYSGKTYAEFYEEFLPGLAEDLIKSQTPLVQEKLNFIGFTDKKSIVEKNGSAAEILQSILVDKWKLKPEDRDWVVMVHFFRYTLHGKNFEIESYFSLEGETSTYTAMSKTVGMPIAFATELILHDKIKARGVLMPTERDIYLPILKRLAEIGIEFIDTIKEI
ncbi:MAG: saccharopine dehydrogenase C-terminal domain-containing protein [Chitinophagales bacterium]